MIDAKVVESLLARRVRQDESALRTLSPRELEVLGKMAEGSTNPCAVNPSQSSPKDGLIGTRAGG